MHPSTAAIAPSGSMRAPRVRPAPRCPRTRLTKPECHCPGCLLEQIAAHGRPAALAPSPAAAEAPPPAGVML